MKIGILGAGAMGCNVGGHLKLGGAEVWLIDKNQEHMKKIADKGLLWIGTDGYVYPPIQMDGAVTDPKECGTCEVVIVLTKCQYLRIALDESAALFDKDTIVLTFQNGLGAEDILLEKFSPERVGYGVAYCGGQLIEAGKTVMSRSKDKNLIFRCVKGGENPTVKKLEQYFEKSGFPVCYTEETDQYLWTKLCVNCMANLPLALMHLPGYYAYVDEDGDVLTDMVAKEAMEVAHALGYAVCWEDIAQVKQKAIDTKYVTLNSCSYDVKNKCSTEVEFLNGAIVKMGKKVGVPTPVNETLVRMMRCVERTYAYQF